MILYRNTEVKVRSQDGDTEYFDIVPGVLQGDTLAPYLFIICLDYVLWTSIQGTLNKFPDFFRMGTFIETLVHFQVILSGCNALVPLQQLLEGSMEVFLCECVNDLRHSLFHLLNCLITTASKFFLELRE